MREQSDTRVAVAALTAAQRRAAFERAQALSLVKDPKFTGGRCYPPAWREI